MWPGAVADGGATDLHSVVGADGSPANYPLHPSTGLKDAALTQAANPDGSCKVPAGAPTPPPGTVCGDYAVNTIQPSYQPYAPGTPDTRRLPPLTNPTIGDRLSARHVDWAWYSGGWDNAAGNVGGPGWTNGTRRAPAPTRNALPTAVYPNCAGQALPVPPPAVQLLREPTRRAPPPAPRTCGTRQEFLGAAKAGPLKPVSFVKPLGEENEHPGYASEHNGSSHLVDLIKAIRSGPDGQEHGDHRDLRRVRRAVGPRLAADRTGRQRRLRPGHPDPGADHLAGSWPRFSVDHTSYDTTSIIATIEHRYGLAPLGPRDAAVGDLSADLGAATALTVDPARRRACPSGRKGRAAFAAWSTAGLESSPYRPPVTAVRCDVEIAQ